MVAQAKVKAFPIPKKLIELIEAEGNFRVELGKTTSSTEDWRPISKDVWHRDVYLENKKIGEILYFYDIEEMRYHGLVPNAPQGKGRIRRDPQTENITLSYDFRKQKRGDGLKTIPFP